MLAKARERYGVELIVNFCGSPERCRGMILDLAARHGVREVVIQAQLCESDQQERMFRLLANAMLRDKGTPRREQARSRAA